MTVVRVDYERYQKTYFWQKLPKIVSGYFCVGQETNDKIQDH
jgi:hypothetical protein